MNSAVRTLMAVLTAIAIALPSVSAAVPASRSAEQPGIAGDRSALIAERQQRTWLQLSGSICTGCINAANRVAPVSYDKPSVIALARPSPRVQTVSQSVQTVSQSVQTVSQRVQTVSRRVRAKMRFAHVRTRYARLQRRDRRRLAIRPHPVRIAKRLHRRIFARHHGAPVIRQVARRIVWPVDLIRVEDRLSERPVGQPWVPQDDNRWHTTILPAATMRSRRS